MTAWARSRLGVQPSLHELLGRTAELVEAVDLLGEPALDRDALRRLARDLSEPSWTWQPAQAGLAHVARPGAVLGPARTIVWWNFTRESAALPRPLMLTGPERQGLRDAGLEPPDASLAMAIEVDGWWRPLTQASEALILACPETDAQGEPTQAHPLWDDITASLSHHRFERTLVFAEIPYPVPAARVDASPRPLVTPRRDIDVGSPVALRKIESPSSLEKLLGCPLTWALHYRGWLRRGALEPIAPAGSPALSGTLAHRILEQALLGDTDREDRVAEQAGALFDAQIGTLAEDFELPRYQADRATLRRAIVESARELTRLRRKHGVREVATETKGQTEALGLTVEGFMDLVWDDPAVVLDLKWGKSRRLKMLQDGTAFQLAAYAAMREAVGKPSQTAYFVLLNQQLLAEPGGILDEDARDVGSHRVADIWKAGLLTLRNRRKITGIRDNSRRRALSVMSWESTAGGRPTRDRTALQVLRARRALRPGGSPMKVRIVTASAGTGKTTRLAQDPRPGRRKTGPSGPRPSSPRPSRGRRRPSWSIARARVCCGAAAVPTRGRC